MAPNNGGKLWRYNYSFHPVAITMNPSDYFIQRTNQWTTQQLDTASTTGPISPLRTSEENYTAVVRGSIPVHVEVSINLGAILPESDITDTDVQWFLDFFVKSIRDMSLSVSVVNRMQFRVWLVVPTSINRSCPPGWEADTSLPSTTTPIGTDIPGTFSFFRRDFQFNEDWSLRPQQPAVTPSFTAPERVPVATSFTFNNQQHTPAVAETKEAPSFTFGPPPQAAAKQGFTFGQPQTQAKPTGFQQPTFAAQSKPFGGFGTGQEKPQGFSTGTATGFGGFQQPQQKPLGWGSFQKQPAKTGFWG